MAFHFPVGPKEYFFIISQMEKDCMSDDDVNSQARRVIATFCRPKAIFVGISMLLRFLMFHRSIENHRKTLNEKSRNDDFIYQFLEEQEKYKNNPEMKPKFSDSQLKWILSDIFIAAVETSVATIRWALVMASENPGIQQTLFDEIESVIGRINTKCLHGAFISEVLRRWSPIPLLMHATSKDVVIDHYNIPKNTWVVANLWGIHMNKKVEEAALVSLWQWPKFSFS
ncbi:cytochrome P450 2U1 [Armadillidium vulgare]|nr:cytochrome P450 2U1 [Armadillidium vulgare]